MNRSKLHEGEAKIMSTGRLSHTRWECKYHVIFIPKYRKKRLYGALKRHLGAVFRELAQQKESLIEEGHLCADHVHMLIGNVWNHPRQSTGNCQAPAFAEVRKTGNGWL